MAVQNDDIADSVSMLDLCDRIEKLLKRILNDENRSRVSIAIAGPPGAGKTTLGCAIAKYLNESAADAQYDLKSHPSAKSRMQGGGLQERKSKRAVCVPMDGYHLYRHELEKMPHSEGLFKRRGSPWTFDVAGIVDMVRRVRDSSHLQLSEREDIFLPSFDHSKKDPSPDGVKIAKEVEIVIMEGNYLLYDETHWRDIADMVDFRWFLHVEEDVARQRLAARHLASGIETSMEDAIQRVEGNDILNMHLIVNNLIQPDLFIKSDRLEGVSTADLIQLLQDYDELIEELDIQKID